MKRIALFLAALSLLATTIGAAPLKVVTTIQDLASLTKEVGGDRVDVSAIARGYQDPHFVEPKPSFLLLLRNADLLEVVGRELEIGWMPALAPYRGAKVVTYHNSWPNFAKHFGLDVVAYVEPKPGVPPSPSHTFELINLMKQQHVKAILMEPYFDSKTPQSIAERTGAKLVVLYPSVGGAKSGTDDYFQLFDTNVANLVKALQ